MATGPGDPLADEVVAEPSVGPPRRLPGGHGRKGTWPSSSQAAPLPCIRAAPGPTLGFGQRSAKGLPGGGACRGGAQAAQRVAVGALDPGGGQVAVAGFQVLMGGPGPPCSNSTLGDGSLPVLFVRSRWPLLNRTILTPPPRRSSRCEQSRYGLAALSCQRWHGGLTGAGEARTGPGTRPALELPATTIACCVASHGPVRCMHATRLRAGRRPAHLRGCLERSCDRAHGASSSWRAGGPPPASSSGRAQVDGVKMASAVLIGAGLVVGVTALVLLHLLPTGLSPLRNAVSQYGISRYRAGYRVQTLAYAVAGAGAAIGVATLPGPAWPVVALCATFAVTRAVISWFPMDVPGTTRTRTGGRHGALAVAAFLAAGLASREMANLLDKDGAHPGIAATSSALAVLMALSLIGMVVSRRVDLFGAAERVFYVFMTGWLATVAVLVCLPG